MKNPGKFKKIFSAKKRLKWGVAGCGRFTENAVLPILTQLKKSAVVSVYSSNAARAKFIANKFSVSNSFSDYEEFLKSDFDVLYIGSANQDHHYEVIKAAEYGKHILCEKPIALNSMQAAEMVEACEKNNVVFSVDYVHRFHPLVRKAKEWIDNGMLGKIISIEAAFNFDYPPDSNYRFSSDFGGGPLMDVGTHMIDLLRYFNGEIVEAKGFLDNIIYHSDVEDTAIGILKFKNPGYGIINVSFNAKKSPNQIYILGHKGYLTIDKIIAAKNESAKLTIDIVGNPKATFRRRANLLQLRLKEFEKSMLKGEVPEVNGIDGLNNMKVMELLSKNALG